MRFFCDKINDVAKSTEAAPSPIVIDSTSSKFTEFSQLDNDDVNKLIDNASNKQCPLDPAPTWLIKASSQTLAPLICHIINRSLSEGYMPDSRKRLSFILY